MEVGMWVWLGLVAAAEWKLEIVVQRQAASRQQPHDSGHCGHQCGEIMAAAAAGLTRNTLFTFSARF